MKIGPHKNTEDKRIEDARRLSRRRFLRNVFLGAAGLSAAGAAHANQLNDLEVLEYTVEIPGWPQAKNGYAIGQISDLHFDSPGAIHRAGRAVSLLLSRAPDVVAITGDFVSDGQSKYLLEGVQTLLPLKAAPGGALAILGNHDWYDHAQERVAGAVAAAGITMLRNRSVPVPSVPNAYFVGIDDVSYGAQDLQKALNGVPHDAIRILLVHEPDFADVTGPGFALQLSGHSHGGQIRVPGLPPLHTPTLGSKYPQGLQQSPTHPVYTSKGVGVTGIDLRLYCPPDVTILRLQCPPTV
jgi:predicted MPP superfamily phosphohydrolase